MTAATDAKRTSLRLLRLLLHGSGTAEEWVVHQMELGQGDLAPGQAFAASLDWELPDTPELSYAGLHLKCDWVLDVYVDRPLAQDWHLRFPLLMRSRDELRSLAQLGRQ